MESMIAERIRQRLKGELTDDALLREYADTAVSRICLRLGTEQLPALFETIAVDAAVKMHRRRYFEGIRSEPNDSMVSMSFVEDILAEYDAEFTRWRESQRERDLERVVRFV